jgi:putative tryptophan/tyrosine transport system substrate-binding protein
MTRREFIGGLGSTAAWPFAVRAQASKLPTIGFLGAGTPATAGAWVAAFAQRLLELGWIEDRTIRIDLCWAEGRNDRSAEIAARLRAAEGRCYRHVFLKAGLYALADLFCLDLGKR